VLTPPTFCVSRPLVLNPLFVWHGTARTLPRVSDYPGHTHLCQRMRLTESNSSRGREAKVRLLYCCILHYTKGPHYEDTTPSATASRFWDTIQEQCKQRQQPPARSE